ncbi:HTH-type transcriptional repressor NicS [compost metagenome]
MSSVVLETLGHTLERGVAEGVFREGIEVIDLHMLMSSFCFYRVSNRHTFSEIFQIDMTDDQVKQRHKQMIGDVVLRYIRA